MSKHKRNTSLIKRKALEDITESNYKTSTVDNIMPICLDRKICANDVLSTEQRYDNSYPSFHWNYQNVHPLLPWYKHDLETTHMSYEKLQNLVSLDNELQLLDFLTEVTYSQKIDLV